MLTYYYICILVIILQYNIIYIIYNNMILKYSYLLNPISICILCLLITLSLQQPLPSPQSYHQFLSSTPSTFGLLTVTHARNGVYTYFKQHLEMYATMDCPQITQISVVWNNDITPLQAGFMQNIQWKRPVYFRKTQHNSMDYRYQVPQESNAKVFFSMDDDVVTSCIQLRKSFTLWRKSAIGDIGPLISYGPRGFDFNTKNQSFVYQDPQQARFYTISLIGVAWVSRFFLDLYNSDQIYEVFKMRQIVRKKNNCDDIALNYIVSYFFPQLIQMPMGGNLSFLIHPNSQSLMSNHYGLRTECVKQFTQILGINPLRLVNKADPPNSNRFESTTLKPIIYMRRIQLYNKFLASKQTPTAKPDSPQLLQQLHSQNKSLSLQQLKLKLIDIQGQFNIVQSQLKNKQQQYNQIQTQVNNVQNSMSQMQRQFVIVQGVTVAAVSAVAAMGLYLFYICCKNKVRSSNSNNH